MRSRCWRIVGCLGTALVVASSSWAQSTALEAERARTQAQREAMQERVQQLQENIRHTLGQRDDAREQLRAVEAAISAQQRKLVELDAQLSQHEAKLQQLQQDYDSQTQRKEHLQQRLADQLRAQYASGLSPWAALFSGQDPHEIQRELHYLAYVTEAQAEAVERLNEVLERLRQLQLEQQEAQQHIAQLHEQSQAEQARLESHHAEHKVVLAQIESDLTAQRGQAEQAQNDAERLAALVQGLEAEIHAQRAAEQAAAQEAARVAAEQARREAEQQADQAEQQAQALRAQAETAQEAARAAQQEAQAERERAEQAQQELQLAQQLQVDPQLLEREGLERGQAPTLDALQAQAERAQKAQLAASQAAALKEQEAQAAQAKVAEAEAARAEAARAKVAAAKGDDDLTDAEQKAKATQGASAAPTAARTATETVTLSGLHKGLPMPTRGTVQGRFGAERPDGGSWRGIVILAAEGSAAQAVAPGEVVYADWLSGFGNLLILDHGEGYLTIYGHNQSLLKQVGERVRQGEVVAQVGATGGQIESGLYFEIRHQGQPVNPQLWLASP